MYCFHFECRVNSRIPRAIPWLSLIQGLAVGDFCGKEEEVGSGSMTRMACYCEGPTEGCRWGIQGVGLEESSRSENRKGRVWSVVEMDILYSIVNEDGVGLPGMQ